MDSSIQKEIDKDYYISALDYIKVEKVTLDTYWIKDYWWVMYHAQYTSINCDNNKHLFFTERNMTIVFIVKFKLKEDEIKSMTFEEKITYLYLFGD